MLDPCGVQVAEADLNLAVECRETTASAPKEEPRGNVVAEDMRHNLVDVGGSKRIPDLGRDLTDRVVDRRRRTS